MSAGNAKVGVVLGHVVGPVQATRSMRAPGRTLWVVVCSLVVVAMCIVCWWSRLIVVLLYCGGVVELLG